MESPCSSFPISKVAEDTRMYCCAIADIVNLENSLIKYMRRVNMTGMLSFITSRLGRNLGH